jgi:two-component system response regulator (stage 0 sporulation protein A)
MTNLEQKIDLIMQYVAAEDANEKDRLRDEIRNALSSTEPEAAVDIPYPTYDEAMDDTIEDLFKDLGVPCHLLGYDRAAFGIKLAISDKEYIHSISKRMYPAIAEEFDTSVSRVERSIRHLIEVAWNRQDIDNAYRIFGYTIDINKGRPTNSEFIAACAKEVKRRMRDGK